jgi:hypothetical protein
MPSDLHLSLGFLAEFNAQTAIKLLIVALLSPFWWPIARVMRDEVIECLAPGGGLMGNKSKRPSKLAPPGLDPFRSVPLARHRSKTQMSAPRPSSSPGRQADVLTPQAKRRGGRPQAAPRAKRSSF